jgi:hypothetical protein
MGRGWAFRGLLVFVVGAAPSIVARATGCGDARCVPYALSISGGVSLGAYEAGINWVTLRYLRAGAKRAVQTSGGGATMETYPGLVAVTGASAGGINALISAMSWCLDERKLEKGELNDGVSDNLLFNIWTTVGLDSLLPPVKPGEKKYLDDDGVFTRNAFDKVLTQIARIIGLEKPQTKTELLPFDVSAAARGAPPVSAQGPALFRDGCEIAFGVTVTSEEGDNTQVAGITVKNHRHFIPLILRVEDGRAVFYSGDVDPGTPGLGNVIFLPRQDGARRDAPGVSRAMDDDKTYRVSHRAVLNAVLASSAFPVAFGRRRITYCSFLAAERPEDRRCPHGLVRRDGMFLDGGIFDNVPLGATKILAEREPATLGRRVSYLYIDPDNRRSPHRILGPDDVRRVEEPRFDFASQFGFLEGAVDTARTYELYKTLTSGDWTGTVRSLTDRLVELIERHPDFPRADADTLVAPDCAGFAPTLRSGPARVDRTWLLCARAAVRAAVASYEYSLQYGAADSAQLSWQRRQSLNQLDDIAKALKKNAPALGAPIRSLHAALGRAKDDPLDDRQVMLSSRFFPVTGEYLYAFAAFFDKPFREFDYYVGVYDGIHSVADATCRVRRAADRAKDCSLGGEVRELYEAFDIASDPKANFVFAHIAYLEHVHDNAPDAHDWTWVKPPDADARTARLHTVLRSLYDTRARDFDLVVRPVDDFKTFVTRLKRCDYPRAEASEYLRRAMDNDGEDWWSLPVARLTGRLHDLELAANDPSSNFEQPLGVLADAADCYDRGVMRCLTPRSVNRDTHQKTLTGYLPHEYGVGLGDDLGGRSLYLAWEAAMRLHNALRLHVVPIQYLRDEEPVRITQLGVRAHTAAAGLHLGLGFDYTHRWDQNVVNGVHNAFGLSGIMEWGCLRVTGGLRDFDGELTGNGDNLYVNLAFVLTGACFTPSAGPNLARAASGSP